MYHFKQQLCHYLKKAMVFCGFSYRNNYPAAFFFWHELPHSEEGRPVHMDFFRELAKQPPCLARNASILSKEDVYKRKIT